MTLDLGSGGTALSGKFTWGKPNDYVATCLMRRGEPSQTLLAAKPHWQIQLAPDGSFRSSGVPPGEYELTFSASRTIGNKYEVVARHAQRVTVTAADVTRGELVLPALVPQPTR